MIRRYLTLAAFLVLVFGGGSLIGSITVPGDWYAELNKPVFDPPNWVFGPVWAVLYIIVAVIGWRTWEAGKSSARMQLWWGQLVLNFLWSPAFFALQAPWIALVVVLALLVVILVFVRQSWTADRVSAIAFAPYAAWVAFASALNLSIAILN